MDVNRAADLYAQGRTLREIAAKHRQPFACSLDRLFACAQQSIAIGWKRMRQPLLALWPRLLPMWSCPFCGRTGQRSKEHVWPRVAAKYPAARGLMNGYRGERFQRQEDLMYADWPRRCSSSKTSNGKHRVSTPTTTSIQMVYP